MATAAMCNRNADNVTDYTLAVDVQIQQRHPSHGHMPNKFPVCEGAAVAAGATFGFTPWGGQRIGRRPAASHCCSSPHMPKILSGLAGAVLDTAASLKWLNRPSARSASHCSVRAASGATVQFHSSTAPASPEPGTDQPHGIAVERFDGVEVTGQRRVLQPLVASRRRVPPGACRVSQRARRRRGSECRRPGIPLRIRNDVRLEREDSVSSFRQPMPGFCLSTK